MLPVLISWAVLALRVHLAFEAHELCNFVAEERCWRELAEDGASVGKRGLAVLMREQGNYAEALTCAWDLEDHFQLAKTYFAQGDWESSAQHCARLLSDDPLTWYDLALALSELGHDTCGIFENVAARTPTADPTHFYSCAALADFAGDAYQADELYAIAQEIEGR